MRFITSPVIEPKLYVRVCKSDGAVPFSDTSNLLT